MPFKKFIYLFLILILFVKESALQHTHCCHVVLQKKKKKKKKKNEKNEHNIRRKMIKELYHFRNSRE